jgi:putative phosphoserine phosphatase/1-acylglycerol-3-phosphate O-acyltransferase
VPSTPHSAAFFRLEGAVAAYRALDAAARIAASAQSMRRRVVGRALAAFGEGLSLSTPFADPRGGARVAWAALEGMSRDRIEVLAIDFARDEVIPNVRPEARRLLQRAKDDGATTVLVSDGLRPIAEDVARALGGFDHVIANELAFEHEAATGALLDPVVGPELDPVMLTALASKLGIDLTRSSAYGARDGDAMLLSHVGRPCALCPDRGLARIARDLGWPIVVAGGAA